MTSLAEALRGRAISLGSVERTVTHDRRRLVLLAFLLLFLELALIRWTGSNVLYLSYFSNFVLLGSFLGIGLGFLAADRRWNLFPWSPVALALLVAFVSIFPVEVARQGDDVIYFGSYRTTGIPAWITLPVVFLAAAATLACIAQGVARVFRNFEPLEAYRLDILGSVLGIGAFTALSFLGAPPLVWGVVVAVLMLLLGARPPGRAAWQVLALAGILFALAGESLQSHTSWSPYYKVTLAPPPQDPDALRAVGANGIPHQNLQSVAGAREDQPIYFLPYQRLARTKPDRVLIVGAGNGTDVAIALAHGARHVDAVEIDPELQRIGRRLHPDRPYSDPRVNVHITDGRAFLERTDQRYDLILFALPDSLTLVSGQAALRLESYLFTREAMRSARERLAPEGVFAMYNYYREPWLIDRLSATLQSAFGPATCVDSVGRDRHRLALLASARDASALRCSQLAASVPRGTPPPTTDDYPFLYLRERSIPGRYLLAIGLILLLSVVTVRALAGGLRSSVRYADLFFMGAAFLLLETKNVVQFSLLFGSTWLVNGLVFGGILVTVLAAIEVVRRVRMPRVGWLYGALGVSLLVAFAIPQHALLGLPYGPRLVAAVLLAFTPVFLANLVFAERFRSVGSSTMAFGTNLLGAMVGGLIEYFALVIGYRHLLLVVAVLYALAFLLRPGGLPPLSRRLLLRRRVAQAA